MEVKTLLFFKNWKSKKQLRKEIKELNEKLEECNKNYDITKELYTTHCKLVKTLKANCITQNKGVSENDGDLIARECLCNELAKELLPYVYFEKYLIADKYNHEIKHVGSIKIVADKPSLNTDPCGSDVIHETFWQR